jgi:type III secretion system HrpE/YscL family protein
MGLAFLITTEHLQLLGERKVLKEAEYATLLDAAQVIESARGEARRIVELAAAQAEARRREGYEEGLRQARAEQADSLLASALGTAGQMRALRQSMAQIVAKAVQQFLGDAEPAQLMAAAMQRVDALIRHEPFVVARVAPAQEAALRDALARLGVSTLGQLVRLPGGGVLERFGPAAHRLYRLAAGEGWDPLAPEPPPEAPDERVYLDDPELDAERLVFATKGALDRLLVRLADKRRALTALYLELNLQHGVGRHERRVDCIKPAAATLDGRALLGLVRLRLEHQPPVAGVVEVRVWADDVEATREQLALFAEKPRRDLRAADVALARLRAELGDDAVVRAVIRPGHLPEARYGWERLDAVVAPRPRLDRPRALVRRVFARPLLLPPQSPNVRDDGWVLSGLAHGTVTNIVGPYILSGGWWSSEVHREYHFAEIRRGDCLWLFYDRARRRWFQHGAVE